MLKTVRLFALSCLFVAAALACHDGSAEVSDPLSVAEDELVASHHWECRCTCSTSAGGDDEDVSWDCSDCSGEGNQCRASEGSGCETAKDTGTLQGCVEFLVRNPPATQLAIEQDAAELGNGP